MLKGSFDNRLREEIKARVISNASLFSFGEPSARKLDRSLLLFATLTLTYMWKNANAMPNRGNGRRHLGLLLSRHSD